MQKEVTDEQGMKWTCVQAFSALGKEAAADAADRMGCDDGKVAVVCTPSGGAQSVRLQLPADWQEATADEELLAAIRSASNS